MKFTTPCVRRSTERAVLVYCEQKPYRLIWLPRSMIRPDDLQAGDRDVVIEVEDWLMRQKLEDVCP